MAYQKPGLTDSFEVVTATLVGKEYYLAKLDTVGRVELAGDGELAIGTIQEGKAVGQHATIMLSGITKVVAGAVFNAGVELASDADGKAITATTGENIVGVALKASGADLEVVPMLIRPNGTAA